MEGGVFFLFPFWLCYLPGVPVVCVCGMDVAPEVSKGCKEKEEGEGRGGAGGFEAFEEIAAVRSG